VRGARRAVVILSKMKSPPRAADPYRDTAVIDARAPRFNQAVVGLVSLAAVTVGPWWLLALLALQLAVGLTFGRRFCLPCVAYFELVQPRVGEGPLEDARPPRFANLVGVVFLGSASVAFAAGAATLGTALGALVAALALLAATAGFCAGCEAFKLGYLLSGRRFESCPLPPRPAPASRSL
jgi:phosphate/sulfate permease